MSEFHILHIGLGTNAGRSGRKKKEGKNADSTIFFFLFFFYFESRMKGNLFLLLIDLKSTRKYIRQ